MPIKKKPGVIGILTGGGDVPGLNPAIRAVTICAARGLSGGWHSARRAGLTEIIRDKNADNSANYQFLTEEIVNRAGRTGGTFLHSSRTNPARSSRRTCRNISRASTPKSAPT